MAKLAALDTGERDRALAGNQDNRPQIVQEISNPLMCSFSSELEKTKMELRELQLRERELQVLKNTFQSKLKKFEANTIS